MDGLMSIGEFAARTGLTPKRLRSYAVGGLLTPVAVDPDSAYRYYSPKQLAQAELIDVLRRAGMPLSEIKVTLQDRCVDHVDRWAARVRSDAEVRQQAIARARALLSAADEELNTMSEKSRGKGPSAWQCASRTETGPVRLAHCHALGNDGLLVVADGMGGHQAGEIASSLAVHATSAVFTGRSVDELAAAMRAANWAVWERACSAPELQGMGTTMCAVGLVDDMTIAVGNVGDSRAYLARAGVVQVLTADHTVAAELARQGELSASEAAAHPHRRLLTRALGVGPEVSIDMSSVLVHQGDRVLICSDGVFSTVADDQLGELLDSSETPQSAVDAIVDMALANGSDDNVSAVAAFWC